MRDEEEEEEMRIRRRSRLSVPRGKSVESSAVHRDVESRREQQASEPSESPKKTTVCSISKRVFYKQENRISPGLITRQSQTHSKTRDHRQAETRTAEHSDTPIAR